MYTNDDVLAVIAYNKTARIYTVSAKQRIMWDVRNKDVAYLNSVLSKQIITQNDFAQLKKQVRAMLLYIAARAVHAQHVATA